MRKDDILTIEVAKADLAIQIEFWQQDTYQNKYRQLCELTESKTSFKPFGNAKLIREVSFTITQATSIEDILKVCKTAEERYKIACFQISIDRKSNIAHLLFTWLNMENGRPILLSNWEHLRLSALFLRKLNLPRPKSIRNWLRYILQDAYMENKNVFEELANQIKEDKSSTEKNNIIKDALAYAEQMSKGLVK